MPREFLSWRWSKYYNREGGNNTFWLKKIKKMINYSLTRFVLSKTSTNTRWLNSHQSWLLAVPVMANKNRSIFVILSGRLGSSAFWYTSRHPCCTSCLLYRPSILFGCPFYQPFYSFCFFCWAFYSFFCCAMFVMLGSKIFSRISP